MMISFRKLSRISLWKTIRFNITYFGLRSIASPKVLIGKNVKLITLKGGFHIDFPARFGEIKIGIDEVGIFDNKYEKAIFSNSGIIHCIGKLNLGQGVRIDNHGELFFGKNVVMTANSSLICYKSIKIGNECLISWDNLLMDTDFHSISYDNGNKTTEKEVPIDIGDNVWIGCRCLILKGANIPNGCVIAANSKVTSKISTAHSLICNNEVKRTNIVWNR